MRSNSKINEYLNLFEDSLRLGHLQIQKIYEKLKNIDKDKYVNIRTGYQMKFHQDSDYIYSKGKYRLCWNSEAIGLEYDPVTIEKILRKFEELIDDYSENHDNKRIRELIDKEISKEGKEKIDNTFPNRERKIDDYFKHYNNIDFPVSEEEKEDEEEEEEKNSEDSFICGDDEIYESDGKKRKFFKKRLGRRCSEYENINEIYEFGNVNTTPRKSSKKLKKKFSQENEDENEMLKKRYNDLNMECENEENVNNGNKKARIFIDDDEEDCEYKIEENEKNKDSKNIKKNDENTNEDK